MASKRRGILAGLAGLAMVAVKGMDEGAALLARAIDELLVAVRRGGDEAAGGGDDAASGGDDSLGAKAVEKGRRYVRRKRIESILEGQSTSETFALGPGWYGGFQIASEYDGALRYELEREADQPVDVLLFDGDAFSKYADGRDAEWRAEGTTLYASEGGSTVALSGGRSWYLIVDNTAAGFAPTTDETATVDLTVRLQPR